MTLQHLTGVIGCGFHAIRSHIQIGQRTDLVLNSFYDPLPQNMEKALKTSLNGKAYSSAESLLKDSDTTAVLIASPDEFHPAQFLLAVKMKKHVFVEKPLAIDSVGLAVARQALQIAQENGLIVSSCFIRHFDPPYVWIKQNLNHLTHQYGELIHIELDFSYHSPRSAWKHGRSLLLDHFPHEVDYLRWLVGDISFAATKLKDDFDVYAVAGSFDNGVTFLCGGTRKLDSSIYPETIRLRFARGEIILNAKTGIVRHHDQENQECNEVFVATTDYDIRGYGVTNNFSEAISGNAPVYLTPQDILVNTESAIMLVEQNHYNYISA